jgi:hypothetical protein
VPYLLLGVLTLGGGLGIGLGLSEAPTYPTGFGQPVKASVSSSHKVALPSDGWKPGMPQELALFAGPFHALKTPNGACAWLGSTRHSFLWPVGYSVRFGPTELVSPTGRIVARASRVLVVGGGFTDMQTNRSCVVPGKQTWAVQGLIP